MNHFGKDVRRLLDEAGWRFLRHGRGDHDVWVSPDGRSKVTVDTVIKSRHSANAVLKQAGLAKAF